MLLAGLVDTGASQGGGDCLMETLPFSHVPSPGLTGRGMWPTTAYSKGSISYVQNLEAGSPLWASSGLTNT